MPATFLKNAMCNVEVFDRAIDENRSSITKPTSTQFANLNKTVAIVFSQYHHEGDVPKVIMHEDPTPAFAIHPESKDLHVTKGLYDALENDDLRAIVILQTCMLARHTELAGAYSAKTTQYTLLGGGGGAVSGGIVAAATVMAGDAREAKKAKERGEQLFTSAEPGYVTRRKVLRGIAAGLGLGLVGGGAYGKSQDDRREYDSWMQAALADYMQLNNDPDAVKLHVALSKMNAKAATSNDPEKTAEYRAEIGQLLASAHRTQANITLDPLPPTEVTRGRK